MWAGKCCARSGKRLVKISGSWQGSHRAMSRIGRKPIAVPAGVKIQLAPGSIDVQGPKGKMSVSLPRGITLEQKGAELHAIRQNDKQAGLHGRVQKRNGYRWSRVPRRAKGKNGQLRSGLLASRGIPYSRGNSGYRGKADAPDRVGSRPRQSRAGLREYSGIAASRSVQAKRHSHHRRALE